MKNVGEPDWASVGRAFIKVLTVTAALFLAVRVVDLGLWVFFDVDDERTARVYGTAARVANPDLRLLNGYRDGVGLLEATYVLRGEPRGAGPSEGDMEYEIVEDLFGAVRTAPSLDGPNGSLADAIDSVGMDSGADWGLAEKARKTIDGLPQTLVAVAVVEFADSVTTEQLVAFNRRHRICGGADVSYIYSPSFYDDSSEPSSLNAVVWNRNMTQERTWEELAYQCETEPVAALAEFRRWVGLLDEGDDFSDFELDYDWFTGAAEEGTVHGLLIDRWKLADLRKLLDDPEVRTVYLADVAFDLGEVG